MVGGELWSGKSGLIPFGIPEDSLFGFAARFLRGPRLDGRVGIQCADLTST